MLYVIELYRRKYDIIKCHHNFHKVFWYGIKKGSKPCFNMWSISNAHLPLKIHFCFVIWWQVCIMTHYTDHFLLVKHFNLEFWSREELYIECRQYSNWFVGSSFRCGLVLFLSMFGITIHCLVVNYIVSNITG